jgi:hypothetical protein
MNNLKGVVHGVHAAYPIMLEQLYTAEKLARDIMRGVDRNRALIVPPASGRAAWRGMRFTPGGVVRVARFAADRFRAQSG